MAKRSLGFSFKGTWDDKTGLITESGKEEDKVFNVKEILQQWSGQYISITMKIEDEPEQASGSYDENADSDDSEW